MTHKEIVRNATNGNVVDLQQYRMDRRMDVGISPPSKSRQVFDSNRKFKTDRQRVKENQANDYRFKNDNHW
jgi:hypothetical protein